MALSVGIAGLPNVGKSTLLNALSNAHAEASNYPFCTIERNVGVAVVPDPRLTELERILSPTATAPTTIRFVDVAGLVEGASRGEGLGNKFLGHLREVDAILHVVRCFEGEDIVHATGEPDPVRDVAVVETELLLADLETAERALKRAEKAVRTVKGEGKAEIAVLTRLAEALARGVAIRDVGVSEDERHVLGDTRFLTDKPCLYLANTSESDPTGEAPLVAALKDAKGAERVLPVSVEIEAEIAELPEDEQAEFLQELGLEETALDLVVTACYRLLDLVTFYTVAHDKLSAWQLRRGGTAGEAAGKIHGDMEKGFIRAEVMALDDLLRLGSQQALHDEGLLRTVGRDHVVEDLDVLHIHFKG
jgi:GTP-binding protein YchF